MIKGAWRKKRSPIGVRPASVGGLHAPTNWMRSKVTHVLSEVLQNPFCSTSCLRKEIARCVPYRSGAGKLISSQKITRQRPIWFGDMITPLSVFLYSQYCSKVLINKS